MATIVGTPIQMHYKICPVPLKPHQVLRFTDHKIPTLGMNPRITQAISCYLQKMRRVTKEVQVTVGKRVSCLVGLVLYAAQPVRVTIW